MKHTTTLQLYDVEEKDVIKVYKKIFEDDKYTEYINENEKIEYWSFEEGSFVFRLLEKENRHIPVYIMEEKNMNLVDEFEELINNGYAELVEGYFVYDEDDEMMSCIGESIFNYIDDEFIDFSPNAITSGYFFMSEKDAMIYEKIKEIENEYIDDEFANEHDYKEKVKNAVSKINF